MKNMNETLKDLIIGIVLSMIVVCIIGALVSNNKVAFILGDILGSIIAILLSIHLNATIARALDMNEEGAAKYTKKMSILRLIIMGCAVVVALTLPEVFNLIGILGLKISAYLQPLTNRFITKKIF